MDVIVPCCVKYGSKSQAATLKGSLAFGLWAPLAMAQANRAQGHLFGCRRT